MWGSVYMCHDIQVEVRGQFMGVDFLLSTCGAWGLKWRHQALEQAPLPTEPLWHWVLAAFLTSVSLTPSDLLGLLCHVRAPVQLLGWEHTQAIFLHTPSQESPHFVFHSLYSLCHGDSTLPGMRGAVQMGMSLAAWQGGHWPYSYSCVCMRVCLSVFVVHVCGGQRSTFGVSSSIALHIFSFI